MLKNVGAVLRCFEDGARTVLGCKGVVARIPLRRRRTPIPAKGAATLGTTVPNKL